MGFFWICPGCTHENFYSGSKTTNVVVQCKSCKAKVKASSHKKPEIKVSIPERNYQTQPKTTNKLPNIKLNGSLASLIVMCNYAINTIKNKDEVKDKKVGSTWYTFHQSWTKWREYFQTLEDEKG